MWVFFGLTKKIAQLHSLGSNNKAHQRPIYILTPFSLPSSSTSLLYPSFFNEFLQTAQTPHPRPAPQSAPAHIYSSFTSSQINQKPYSWKIPQSELTTFNFVYMFFFISMYVKIRFCPVDSSISWNLHAISYK